MQIRWMVILGCVYVGGCGSSEHGGQQPQASITETQAAEKIKNPAHDWLLAQSNKGQAKMLGQVVGDGCKGKLAFFQGDMNSSATNPADGRPALPVPEDSKNDAIWNVKCTDGRSYSVSVHPDGSGKVLECSAIKALHAGECFKKFG